MIIGANAAGIVSVLAALWVAFAALLAILAARRLRRAQSVLSAARRMRSLLGAAPARALLVHRDDRIEADAKLVRELGLPSEPERLEQLAGDDQGFDREDFAAF